MRYSEILVKEIKREIPLLKEEKIPSEFNETVDMMFRDGNIFLDRERFNILVSYWGLPPISQQFFDYYFKEIIKSIEQFKTALDLFIKDALWHFGDLERAYNFLCETEDIEAFYNEHSFHVKEFTQRLPWTLIEGINPSERGFLGYVSGQRPKQEKELISFIEIIITEFEGNQNEYKKLNKEQITEKVLKKLSVKLPDIRDKVEQFNKLSGVKDLDLFSSKDLDENKKIISNLKKRIDETIDKIEKLKSIGIKNQEHYLRNIESIDVYVATSMRNDDEYLDMYNFVNATFNDKNIKSLNLRYFDPTLCYCESRIDKGLIECLLVRSSKVTIYCAQENDTFGKDSELAATMAQGKPVIVYVPIPKETDYDIQRIEDIFERQEALSQKSSRLENRARTFKEFHPLGMQVGLYDGVARGVIVVRTPEECASILFKILNNSLEVNISYEQNGLVLREKVTNSVLRVMTGWGVLSSCFWNQFIKTQNPKSGIPY